MESRQYEYEVAFSFLAQDESLATELNGLLQERMPTFLYSNRQKEIAGTDGEATFNAVFGKEARVVVILYRIGWGERTWTRIEQTAIKNRAFDEGYEFVITIPLDKPPTVPEWLPKTKLWVGLERWGVPGAVSVIEARVQERGGEVHDETVVERVQRLGRELAFSDRRRQFLASPRGVDTAKKEFDLLRLELANFAAAIQETTAIVTIGVTAPVNFPNYVNVYGLGPGLTVQWHPSYRNTLQDALLLVEFWKGPPPVPGAPQFHAPRKASELKLMFDLIPPENSVWSLDGGSRNFGTKDLASYLLIRYIELADETRRASERRNG